MTCFSNVRHACLLALYPHCSSYRLWWSVAFLGVSFVYRRYWQLIVLFRVWTISNATKFSFVFTLVLRPKLFTDGHKFSYFLWRIYCGVMTDNNNSNLFYRLLGNDSLQQSDPYSPNNNSKVEYALSMPLVMVLLANEGRVRLPKSMFVLLWKICCVHWLEWINEDTCALCRKLFHSSRFNSWLLGRAGNGECDEMKVTFLNQFVAYFCGITFINRFVKMQWFLQHDRRSFNFCRKQMDIHLDLPRGYI